MKINEIKKMSNVKVNNAIKALLEEKSKKVREVKDPLEIFTAEVEFPLEDKEYNNLKLEYCAPIITDKKGFVGVRFKFEGYTTFTTFGSWAMNGLARELGLKIVGSIFLLRDVEIPKVFIKTNEEGYRSIRFDEAFWTPEDKEEEVEDTSNYAK